MNKDRFIKLVYAKELLDQLVYSDDTDVNYYIDVINSKYSVILTPQEVFEITRFINNEITLDFAILVNFNYITKINFLNGVYKEGLNFPSLVYFYVEEDEIETCQLDSIFYSFYTREAIKSLYDKFEDEMNNTEFTHYEFSDVLTMVDGDVGNGNNDDITNGYKFDDSQYFEQDEDYFNYDDNGEEIDPMEVRRDAWGNLYTVGGQMWERAMNKRNEDDDYDFY